LKFPYGVGCTGIGTTTFGEGVENALWEEEDTAEEMEGEGSIDMFGKYKNKIQQ
jgi:hypothetical protein